MEADGFSFQTVLGARSDTKHNMQERLTKMGTSKWVDFTRMGH